MRPGPSPVRAGTPRWSSATLAATLALSGCGALAEPSPGASGRASPQADGGTSGVASGAATQSTPPPQGAPSADGAPDALDAGMASAGQALGSAGAGGQEPAQAQGGGGQIGSSGGPATTGGHLVSVRFTTQTTGGRYAPRNNGVVWVEDTSGRWIHTLEFWGSSPDERSLSRYLDAGGPDYALILIALTTLGITAHIVEPPPDVITGASLPMHVTHSDDSWDLRDADGVVVADGDYRLVLESSEENKNSTIMEVPFTKGPAPQVIMPADSAGFVGVVLTLQ